MCDDGMDGLVFGKMGVEGMREWRRFEDSLRGIDRSKRYLM